MSEERRAKARAAVDALAKKLADEGKLIEGGWAAYHALVIPHDAPEIQVRLMREAFFSGAQHLFHTLTSILEEGSEPTESDLRRMDHIDRELRGFRDHMLSRLGVRKD